MAAKGLRTGAGVIDAGYAGEVGVVLHNLNNKSHPQHPKDLDSIWNSVERGYQIKKGDKIAQLLIYKVAIDEPIEVQELWASERGAAGYGSSGK
jgi:dUTP pyrophosphatase